MNKVLNRLETYLIYAVVFLLPIIVLPISPNPFDVPKLAILVYGVGLVLLIKSAQVITSGKLDLSIGKFDIAVFVFALAYLLSAILRSPNKMDAYLLPGSATAIIAGSLLYFLLIQLRKEGKTQVAKLLTYSGLAFSIILLMAYIGILDKIPQLPAYVRIKSFNTAGGYLPSVVFLATLIPVSLSLTISEKNIARKIFLVISNLLIVITLFIGIYNILPGKITTPRIPSANTSWSIAIDALKESPVFGIGAGNYLTAFSRYRPLSYNQTDLWPIKFATARNYYLTAFTETGLLGAAGMILIFLSIYRYARHQITLKNRLNINFLANSNLISLSVLIILLAIFPGTILLVATAFILLALTTETRETTINLSTQAAMVPEEITKQRGVFTSRLPAFIVTLPIIVFVIFSGYHASRYLVAELTYKKALDALIQNQAAQTYDLMRQAINQNPLVDRYHISYSQVNLALANSIAQNPDITDTDRANIAQLIQQAIREGKAAVALNPFKAGNWEVLARIYQAIVPFAQGADLFATQSFRQAITLDPINPNLRIALGGVHYGQGNFDTSVRVFELATIAKPDHANAHYNLAFALRESGDINRAISEMTVVLSLVDRDSNDYQVARQALEDLEERRATISEAAGEELVPPQSAEEPVIEPPIELPEESEPPEAPITPTPTEEVTPTPTQVPTP